MQIYEFKVKKQKNVLQTYVRIWAGICNTFVCLFGCNFVLVFLCYCLVDNVLITTNYFFTTDISIIFLIPKIFNFHSIPICKILSQTEIPFILKVFYFFCWWGK